MSSYLRPKLGDARNLANRVNGATTAGHVGKPVGHQEKMGIERLKSSKALVNDENRGVSNILKKADGKNINSSTVNGCSGKLKVANANTNGCAGGGGLKSRIPVIANLNTGNILKSRQQKTAQLIAPQPTVAPPAPIVSVPKHLQIENIDADKSIFLLGEYAEDIYKYLLELDCKRALPHNFMHEKNGDKSASTRAILINWLVEVHRKFSGLQNETLYLTVSIIDRYVATQHIRKDEFQLLGATAFFVASKFEEIYFPDVKEIVNLCDNLYTKKQVLQMELKILQVLDFALGTPLVIHFLRRGSKAAGSDSAMHMMGKYLCELSLLDYEISAWRPSKIAAVALYLTLRMFETAHPSVPGNEAKNASERVWTPTIAHYMGYELQDVLKAAPVMCRMIVQSETSKFQHVREKYSSNRLLKMSRNSMLSADFVRELAQHSPRSLNGTATALNRKK